MVAAAGLTRDACYVKIANARCAVNGISQIVNSLIEGVVLGFELQGVKISPEIRSKILRITGQEMESYLRGEYVNKLIEVYKKALTSLSEQELNEIAQRPTASEYQSEAHRKFHQSEQAGFLPIKEKTINELMETGKQLVNQPTIMEEIYKIAVSKK